jgi:hypothetical protein
LPSPQRPRRDDAAGIRPFARRGRRIDRDDDAPQLRRRLHAAHKIRKDGGSDGRGVGFYFRNVTEVILFGVRGKNARTLPPGRSQVNMIQTRKREHSRKPDEQYELIEACSSGPYLGVFGRGERKRWETWGHQADADYAPTWKTYAYNSAVAAE